MLSENECAGAHGCRYGIIFLKIINGEISWLELGEFIKDIKKEPRLIRCAESVKG